MITFKPASGEFGLSRVGSRLPATLSRQARQILAVPALPAPSRQIGNAFRTYQSAVDLFPTDLWSRLSAQHMRQASEKVLTLPGMGQCRISSKLVYLTPAHPTGATMPLERRMDWLTYARRFGSSKTTTISISRKTVADAPRLGSGWLCHLCLEL
jgi:DNA-binding transcriptional MocR family regulator